MTVLNNTTYQQWPRKILACEFQMHNLDILLPKIANCDRAQARSWSGAYACAGRPSLQWIHASLVTGEPVKKFSPYQATKWRTCSHWQNRKGNGKLIRAVSQLAGQTKKTGWFIAANSKMMLVTCRITMGANSSANQCRFNISAPPPGSVQKHLPITKPRQWIVHSMNIDSPGQRLEGRALRERVLMMGVSE